MLLYYYVIIFQFLFVLILFSKYCSQFGTLFVVSRLDYASYLPSSQSLVPDMLLSTGTAWCYSFLYHIKSP